MITLLQPHSTSNDRTLNRIIESPIDAHHSFIMFHPCLHFPFCVPLPKSHHFISPFRLLSFLLKIELIITILLKCYIQYFAISYTWFVLYSDRLFPIDFAVNSAFGFFAKKLNWRNSSYLQFDFDYKYVGLTSPVEQWRKSDKRQQNFTILL